MTKRVHTLDSLRGYAILGVILVHSEQWMPSRGWLHDFSIEGARGVQLFFVTSALTFFINYRAAAEVRQVNWRSFLTRRFWRIAPMFYLGVMGYLIADQFSPRFWAPFGLPVWAPAAALAFLHGWHPETITSVVPGSWSIAAEAGFYAILPFLLTRIRTLWSAIAFLCLAVGLDWLVETLISAKIVGFYPPDFAYVPRAFFELWLPRQLPVFACGIGASFLLPTADREPSRYLGAVLLVLALAIYLLLPRLNLWPSVLTTQSVAGVMAVAFALALFHLRTSILDNVVTQFLGRISYSLYFTHFVILRLLENFGPKSFSIPDPLGTLLAFAIVVVAAGAVATLTYRFIEIPTIALGRRFSNKALNSG